MYNGKLVIDVISENDAIELLKIPKISLMINGIWDGEYEQESFMSYSLNFQIFKSIVLNQKNMIGYSPDYVEEISLFHNIIQIKKYLMLKNLKSKTSSKGHFFTFKIWKSSIGVRYLIDAIAIITVGIFLQINFNEMQDLGVRWYSIYPQFLALSAKLNDTSLTTSQRASAQADFISVENQYLSIGNQAYDYLISNYIIFSIMTAYLFKNICQSIYARMRQRSWRSVFPEYVISSIQAFITIVLLYRYFAYQRFITASDPRYTHLEIVKSTYYNETFLDMTIASGLYVGLQWARIILVFRINSFIGPLLNIIYSMIIEIAKFMVIYWLLILIFWSCGRIFFITIKSFSTDLKSFATLFSASLGGFDFSIFNDSMMVLDPEYGYYYLIIFLILSNIILLNFVIAILSNTYTVKALVVTSSWNSRNFGY